MGILLQEVVLDLPGIVVAKLVRQFDLVERVLIELALIVRSPRARELQFIEDAEFHDFPCALPYLLTSIPPEAQRGVKLRWIDVRKSRW